MSIIALSTSGIYSEIVAYTLCRAHNSNIDIHNAGAELMIKMMKYQKQKMWHNTVCEKNSFLVFFYLVLEFTIVVFISSDIVIVLCYLTFLYRTWVCFVPLSGYVHHNDACVW